MVPTGLVAAAIPSLLAQVKPPTPGTSIPNPAEETVRELTNLDSVCKDDSSWVCTWVKDHTGNDTLAGLAKWFVAKPLTILVIILLAWLVNRIVRHFIRRSLERRLEPRGTKTGAWLREKAPDALLKTGTNNLRSAARVQTLSTVFRGIATTIIWTIAIFWILDVLEVSVGPLLATAGIAGIALGFGAQFIVRDFLAGMFMVIEDQLGVGDIVDLGDAKGTVEKVTLRSTRVRDVNGVVWHVPNGQIQRVANKSQEWAQAVLDVEVAYDADLDQVKHVMQETAEAMAADERWMAEILETPEVWGVEDFTSSGVTMRLVVKTQPASQFGVMRELRARLKKAFDERGIEMPAAKTELWVRTQDDGEQ